MKRFAAALAVLLFICLPALVLAATPSQNLESLSGHLDVAMARAEGGDLAGSKTEYQAFVQGWPVIEDGIKAQSPGAYQDIEGKMRAVSVAFASTPPNPAEVDSALKALDSSCDAFIDQPASGQVAPASAPSATIASLNQDLVQAQQLAHNDPAAAAGKLKDFMTGWPSIEGVVAAKDQGSYSAIENEMAEAYGLLTSNPPQTAQASALIQDLENRLQPFVNEQVHYGVFDAAIILLREGFEALLVFAALLAFLKRSGNAAKQGWIWAGGIAGLAVSAVIAIVVNLAFARAGGSSRELLEGITGLVAAGMLLWMMFWLHGKSNVKAWNRYISEQTGRALAANSLLSLTAIAFLAVLREGAETILFYVGIAPGISTAQLLLGIGAGAGALVVLAVLMLVVGVRIPIRPFFLATSLLVFFLAFKFAGMGVHSLQVAGRVTSHPAAYLPTSGFFGVFPTWETAIIQIVVLVAAGAGLAAARFRPAQAEASTRNVSGSLSCTARRS